MTKRTRPMLEEDSKEVGLEVTLATPGTIEASLAKGHVPQPIMVPTFHASTSQISITGNDLQLMFSRHQLMQVEGVQPGSFATLQPTVIIEMSLQTAKDLTLLIGRSVRDYEAKFGEIETDYTRSLKSKK